MKFQDYLKYINKKPVTWARENNLSVSTIWRAYTGKHFPSPEIIKKINELSEGRVRPEDWY